MDSTGYALMQFGPLLLISAIYAALIYVVANRRRINPWGWMIGTMIPMIGFIVAAVFFYTTLLSMLDRLNALEGRSNPPVV